MRPIHAYAATVWNPHLKDHVQNIRKVKQKPQEECLAWEILAMERLDKLQLTTNIKRKKKKRQDHATERCWKKIKDWL